MRGLYSLIAENKITGQKKVIVMDEITREKVCISEIDSFTTKYDDDFCIIDDLYSKGIVTTKEIDLYISYVYNGQVMYREILTSEFAVLPKLVSENKSKIALYDDKYEYYSKYIDDALEEIKQNIDLRRYILKSNLINDSVRKHLLNYFTMDKIKDKESEKFILKTRHFCSYKVLRDFIFAKELFYTKNYEEKINLLIARREMNNRIEPEKDYINGQMNLFDNYNLISPIIEEENELVSIAKNFIKEGKELKEMIDLDEISKLSLEEQKKLGFKIG